MTNRIPRPTINQQIEEKLKLCVTCDAFQQIDQLTADLFKYGGHKRHCRVNKKGLVFANCTCGWGARRKELE